MIFRNFVSRLQRPFASNFRASLVATRICSWKRITRLVVGRERQMVHCEDLLPPQSGGKETPLQVQDRLRDDPHWFPSFLDCCSWMFPEQLRNKSELAGSRGIHQALTRLPRCVTLFC